MAKAKPAYLDITKATTADIESVVNHNYVLNGNRQHAKASTGEFRDVQNSITVRDGFDRMDRDWFRPGEEIPCKPKDIIAACMQAYRRIGIVRNVIDMMGEFCSKGIDLVHTNPSVQEFYKEWFKKINGKERTERILNMLYRAGNVPIKRSYGYLTVTQTTNLRSGMIEDDEIAPSAIDRPRRKKIPWTYEIFNPLSVDVIGGDVQPLLGKHEYKYGAWINTTMLDQLRNGVTNEYTGYQPTNLLEDPAFGGRTGTLFELAPADTIILTYKKDDHQVWADPMLFGIYDDLLALKKLKLSDLAALDGACMYVRLWKLGSIEKHLWPTPDTVDKLSSILATNSGGGPMDLIWGPDIELVETNTDISKFLSPEKYMSTLNAIFAGLGIPPTLTGVPLSSNFTNSWTSFKTLIERLQYGRDLIVKLWETEIRLVQKEMKFKEPAKLVFDQQILTDEAALQKLVIELVDRDLISEEAALDRFDFDPKIEDVRKRRERKMRDSGKKPPKASPYHSPQADQKNTELFIQNGVLTPSEVGLELDPKKPGEKTSKELDAELAPKGVGVSPTSTKSKKGKAGEGRPVGAVDTTKRKKRRVLPRTAAGLATASIWAKNAQKSVSEVITPLYLKAVDKKNVRSLNQSEFDGLESFKYAVFANLKPLQNPTEDVLMELVTAELTVPVAMNEYKDAALLSCPTPTVDDIREAQALAVAVYHTELTV